MSNLLPLEQKKNLTNEYHLRVWTVGLFLVAALFAIAIVLLVPPYVLSLHEAQVAQAQVDSLKKEIATKQSVDSTKVISDTNTTLQKINGFIGQETASLSPHDMITKFLSYVDPAISITNIYYTTGDKGGQLSVRGVAKDDVSLSAFAKTLQSEPYFSSVNLPVSTFVKTTDISFAITIQVAVPKNASQ